MSHELWLGSLGGTIAMSEAGAGRGLTPALSADDLLSAVPGLAALAVLRTETVLSKPGASLSLADALTALRRARAAVEAGAVGAVLVQGTDTIEEVAFLLDLFWDRAEPLVLTGAMRATGQVGSDAAANLLDAVTVALDPRMRDAGALVVLNGQVHAAARVRKVDSTALDAFTSGMAGPLARTHEGDVWVLSRMNRPPGLPEPTPSREVRVPMIETTLGEGPELVRAMVQIGVDGLVVSAFGAGHVPDSWVADLAEGAARIPVVLASRTAGGPILSHTYGFAGSERDLLDHGLVGAGWLSPRQARLLLWALLAGGASPELVCAQFATRGGYPPDRASSAPDTTPPPSP